jgi:hypothetical protein
MDVNVEIHCGTCGSANYSMPEGGEEAALVVCNDCSGHLGSVADLKSEMLQQALARSSESLRRELDRLRSGKGPSAEPA